MTISKRIFSVLFLGFAVLLSCGNSGDEHITVKETPSDKSQPQSAATSQLSGTAVAIGTPITAEVFRAKIFDYTSNEAWTYKYDKGCVIDFYADWCRPCKMLDPVLNAAVAESNGAVDLYKVNVDKEKELASVFQIQSIPTLLFCPADGSQPFILQGLVSKEELTQAINKISGNPKNL